MRNKIIDLDAYKEAPKAYGGANGSKMSIYIDNELWLLKFPPAAPLNPDMHYSNSILSEHLGSSIFNILGIPAQQTFLGTRTRENESGAMKSYPVVACRDFADPAEGLLFQDFATLRNATRVSPTGGYTTEIERILDTIDTETKIDQEKLRTFFWDMFIVDAYIGNFDRHNGNWGFVLDAKTGRWDIAPVFDCGSSLYPQADENIRKSIMTDRNEFLTRMYRRPLSAIEYHGEKISYFAFLASNAIPECTEALFRMNARILERKPQIDELIEKTPMTDDDRRFYAFILESREEYVLQRAIDCIREGKKPEESRKYSFYTV